MSGHLQVGVLDRRLSTVETSTLHLPNSPHLLKPKLSICFSGQLPDGVLNVRTSFQSRPSLIALGSKANSVTKFPVFVQTYSNNSNSGNPNDTHGQRPNCVPPPPPSHHL